MKRRAGIAGWAIYHPIGVMMLMMAIVITGLFSLQQLNIDLLPKIIYPDVRVRILNPGVPATIMEDEITRQLEEQLAITENATSILSNTREGRSSVDLSFSYGTDIDVALRDASTRLDRAKRFLPDSIDPPVIFKRDPSQLPIAQYVLSSPLRNASELREWADYSLSKSLLNLPGVAAIEIGGGREREIHVVTDTQRLAAYGLDISDLADVLSENNRDTSAGRFFTTDGEINGRTTGRFTSIEDINSLPLKLGNNQPADSLLRLSDIADVSNAMADEKLRIRLDDEAGLKLSLQKQPQANTVAVFDTMTAALERLRKEGQIPDDIRINHVDDQARYIRQSLQNATTAALSGAILAMFIVYIFLGNIRRTLIIGSAIPIAVLVAAILMVWGGLTLNIMTLGGLALGIGMLVDNTIVMLENIYRHQRDQSDTLEEATRAASEMNSAIVASTSTNLVAILPFLFIGGLTGLLFKELIFTISAAIVASMIVALTVVPALASRIPAKKRENILRRGFNAVIGGLQKVYGGLLYYLLKVSWLVILVFMAGLYFSISAFTERKFEFLPQMDSGGITINLTADPGIALEGMDKLTQRVEKIINAQPDVESLFTTVGGFVFGRSQYERSNRARINVLMKPFAERQLDLDTWIKKTQKAVKKAQLAGLKVRIRKKRIRGIRVSQGEDDLSLRLKGDELKQLETLADRAVELLQNVKGLRNIQHSSEGSEQELSIVIKREVAAQLGLSAEAIGRAVRFAVGGLTTTEFLQNDRSIDVVLRLDRRTLRSPEDLGAIILFSDTQPRQAVRLGEVADIEWRTSPATIMRDKQQRIVEITASLSDDVTLEEAYHAAQTALEPLDFPVGYSLYEAGEIAALQKSQQTSQILLGLALFLVLVVMAVHYESLRDPLVILASVPFAAIGVAWGLIITGIPLSMPVWLGMIMLAGIVVNNTIVLVETIGQQRSHCDTLNDAIIHSAKLRLRPILMTTLTTVVGMLPLAMALGEGSEMLQPLAISIVSGLSFAMLVTLLLVPGVYRLVYAYSGR